ncbi:hypothetical protein FO519_000125 [Halicephalobus sp. NKZ332]|nr:hypothetical protein FO519_000125 [Halicephalobus sp. NKZ332]
MRRIEIALAFAAFLAVVYSAPSGGHDVEKSVNDDWSKKIPTDFADEDYEEVEKRAGIRNPYSWMNQVGRSKRARNPYSWMVQSNVDNEPPITYGWLRGVSKKSRNPYSWMAEPRRTKNPYSWMNFVN